MKVGQAQCKRAEEGRDLDDFLVEIHYILIFKYASIDIPRPKRIKNNSIRKEI